MTNEKKSSNRLPAGSSTPAAATRNGSATSSAAGESATATSQPTICGGGAGMNGDEKMLEMANRLGAKHDDQKIASISNRLRAARAMRGDAYWCGPPAGRGMIHMPDPDYQLDPEKIRAAVERDMEMLCCQSSRVDGGMVVATVAFFVVVFAVGVVVGAMF